MTTGPGGQPGDDAPPPASPVPLDALRAQLRPEPLSYRAFLGKVNLHVGALLHRKLAMDAAEEHLSLNQYILRRRTNAS